MGDLWECGRSQEGFKGFICWIQPGLLAGSGLLSSGMPTQRSLELKNVHTFPLILQQRQKNTDLVTQSLFYLFNF